MVRLITLQSLSSLYDSADNVSKLTNFTDRFLPRFTELISDKDNRVVAEAIKLHTKLLKYIYVIIYAISAAALVLIYYLFFQYRAGRISSQPQQPSAALSEISKRIWNEDPRVRHNAAEYTYMDLFGANANADQDEDMEFPSSQQGITFCLNPFLHRTMLIFLFFYNYRKELHLAKSD